MDSMINDGRGAIILLNGVIEKRVEYYFILSDNSFLEIEERYIPDENIGKAIEANVELRDGKIVQIHSIGLKL